MAPTFYARIEPYARGHSFSNWVERLGYYFKANEVPAEDRKAHLICLNGHDLLRDIKSLFPEKDVQALKYEDVVDGLRKMYDREESCTVRHFRFHSRMKNPNETMDEFITDLKTLALNCDFGEHTKRALRDGYLMGIRDQELLEKLLLEDDLTMESAEKIMYRWEAVKNLLGTNRREPKGSKRRRGEDEGMVFCHD